MTRDEQQDMARLAMIADALRKQRYVQPIPDYEPQLLGKKVGRAIGTTGTVPLQPRDNVRGR